MNKTVLITGISKGLGLALSKKLLDTGYNVAGCSRSLTDDISELENKYKDNFLWVKAEVGNESDEENFVKSASEKFNEKTIYGLINNAGIAKEGILATFPNVDSQDILNVNLLGALRLARLAVVPMLNNYKGRIINISSIIGSNGYTGLTAYSASKAGMDGFTRSLAREVGRRQITVNSVAPGYMRTDMSSSLDDKKMEQIVRRTPIGRLAEVDDIVPAIIFLLSDEASAITGQTITIDGGINC